MAAVTKSTPTELEVAWFGRRIVAKVEGSEIKVSLYHDGAGLNGAALRQDETAQSFVDALNRNLGWLAERGITPTP